MLLAEPEKCRDAINALKKISHICLWGLKNLKKKILSFEWSSNGIHFDLPKISN